MKQEFIYIYIYIYIYIFIETKDVNKKRKTYTSKLVCFDGILIITLLKNDCAI